MDKLIDDLIKLAFAEDIGKATSTTLSIAPDREEAFPALKAFDILVISAACAHTNANIKANVSKSRFISFLYFIE